jgi:hypothetical protein
MDVVQHTKMMPDCRNVTKQNCISTFTTDEQGEQASDLFIFVFVSFFIVSRNFASVFTRTFCKYGQKLLLSTYFLRSLKSLLKIVLFNKSTCLLTNFWSWTPLSRFWGPVLIFIKILLEIKRNGILLPKLFWPTVRKNCSSDRENFLEFAKILRSLEQFVRTVKGLNNFWQQIAFLTCSWRFLRSNKLEQLKFKLEKIIGI